MRSQNHIFHLAIPSADLAESAAFYTQLGCEIARQMPDRITINFFGDQVVCHLAPTAIDKSPQMYPRHFGITFINESDFEALLTKARDLNLTFFAEPNIRFANRPDAHRLFFLIDPSNNLLEFKYYFQTEMMY